MTSATDDVNIRNVTSAVHTYYIMSKIMNKNEG